MTDVRHVLFVCLGNICRSPMAEAVFKEVAEQKGVSHKWYAESAGTGDWHLGEAPDGRTITVLKNNGIPFRHAAVQLTDRDFYRFDFILTMDEFNLKEINKMKPRGATAQILLLGSFDPKGETTIRDPYYDADLQGFVKCFEQCMRSCKAFLEKYD